MYTHVTVIIWKMAIAAATLRADAIKTQRHSL